VTILDAQAVIALLREEAAAEEVGRLVASPTMLSALNAAEVLDQMVRVFGHDAADIHADLARLQRGGLWFAPVTDEVGILAGQLRARHYHRTRRAVSLADCVAAATALTEKQPLATADPALVAMVRDQGGQVHALPDTGGNMP